MRNKIIVSEKEFRQNQTEELGPAVQPYYVQLYESIGEEEESLGSGFLLEYAGVNYVFTAGHVAVSTIGKVYGPRNKFEIINIGSTTPPFGFHTEGVRNFTDKDSAIIPISVEAAKIIKEEHRFYCPSPVEFTHVNYPGRQFLVSGASFKSTKKNWNSNDIEAELQNIRTMEVTDTIYEKLKLDKAEFIVVKFERDKMFSSKKDKRIYLKSLNGMSGSPIWVIMNKLTGMITIDNLKICGILAYYHESEKVLIGNRINILKPILDAFNES